MSEPEKVGAVLQKSLVKIDPALRRKLLQQEILNRWNEIFKSLADKIFPVEIQGETLFVTSNDGAVLDMLKYSKADFIKLINEKISPDFQIISEIKSCRTFGTITQSVTKTKTETIEKQIELTPEEIAGCEKKVATVTNEVQRKILLETLLSHTKSQKRKLQNGWHKCKLCNLLCPPNESICSICEVKERGKLISEVRKIFIEKPETPFREIQQKIIEQFPYLKKECTLEKIESARMDLILQRAAKISYGDTTSDAVIFLVCLIRQLPREKLTDGIIKRTLKEFKFNFADLPPFNEYNFSKLEKRSIKKIPLQKK